MAWHVTFQFLYFSTVGIETKFAGSSCNDLVTMDSAGTVIFSGHFDKKIRLWDARADNKPKEIEVQGKVTSLDLSRGRQKFINVGLL